MKIMLPVGLLLISYLSVYAQPGSLDVSFGIGGKVLTNVDQTRNVTNSVLVQPDGKIVVIGYCTPVDYTGYFTLVRYHSDGSIDSDFGLNGIVTTVINGNEDIAFSGALQADGKIIAAGYTWTGTDYDFAMIRYNTDGTRDLTFGASGIVTADFYGGNDKANQVLIEPDGDIVLIGYTGNDANIEIDMAFARFHSEGALDQSFSNDGKVVVPVSEMGFWESARAAALQTDGKLVVVGYTDVPDPINSSIDLIFAALRLNKDGSLDQLFGNSGIVKMPIAKRAVATSVALSSDGKIIALVETKVTKYGTTDFTLLRLDQSGVLDTAFGTNGMTTMSFDNSDDSGNALFIQPDQKILAAGYTAVNNGSTVDFALARFNPNGTLDNTFGNGGKVTVDFQGGLDFGGAIALQKNGKIIMAGAARVGNDFDFGLVRFENDVALPVKLIRFDVTQHEKQIHLKWLTSDESGSDYFEIQRSADGIKWATIGTVDAAGNSTVIYAYDFIDASPQPGKNLYRLKMVDMDETFAFSSVKTVLFDSTSAKDEFVAYPNPVKRKLNVSLGKGEVLQCVQLYHLNGVLAFQSKSRSSEINFPDLEAGQYVLVLQLADGSTKSQTILISR